MNSTILIFTDRFPYGRSETFFSPEIEFISRSFSGTVIVPFETGPSTAIRSLPENIQVIKPPFRNSKNKAEVIIKGFFNTSPVIPFLKEGKVSGAWKSAEKMRIWITHFLVIRRLISKIRSDKFMQLLKSSRIIYFYWGLRWSQVIPFLPNDFKLPVAVRFHGSDLYEHLNGDYIPWRMQQINRINSYIAVSEAGRKYLLTKYGIPHEKIFLCRIGTFGCGLNPYKKTEIIRIISCSNIVPVKRVELIAAELAWLKIKAEWIHFGDGPLKKKALQSASLLPEDISWRLAGEINHDELFNFYREVSVDLFINVSSSEGVPVSVMEALSFGIPVIATNAGGTSEIVSSLNGMILPVDFAPGSLAKAIEKLTGSNGYMQLRAYARKIWEEKCNAGNLYPEFMNHLLNL